LHCGLNNNPTVGQFVDALKTSIISGLAFRDLRNNNCEDDKTELLDNLHSFLEESDASLPHPYTNHYNHYINKNRLEIVKEMKYLGISFDNRLSFNTRTLNI